MKDRGVLTESMFYVLMSFLHNEMCGIEITEFVERKTHGRVRLGPGTLYTLLGKFQDEHLIEYLLVFPADALLGKGDFRRRIRPNRVMREDHFPKQTRNIDYSDIETKVGL